MKRALGILLAVTLAALLVWGFLEGRSEIALERQRELPIKVPPRVSKNANGASVVTLDAGTQALVSLTIATIPPWRGEDPASSVREDLPALAQVLPVLDAESSRLGPVVETKAAVPPETCPPGAAVLIPVGSVLSAEGRSWVYIQEGPEIFARREVRLIRLAGDSWVAEGPAPGARIVVQGAQLLLSEEQKASIQILEEGEGN